MLNLKDEGYNPDVLCCLANLSNDEVFTPPEIANKMLDLLPQELFRNPTTTFLDPACKSGVFLREIARRLIVGLQPKIPDLQERLDHIFHKQLYGIAITQLTSLLTRRSLYCSKFPNSKYSVSHFDTPEGNIRFRKTQHTWKDGKCVHCGVAEETFGDIKRRDLESHAYEFIHREDTKGIFGMTFDVVIGNPPYQMNVGVEKENYAIPIYDRFVQQAKKLKPRFLTMIIPARWYAGGRNLDMFRDSMLQDGHVTQLVDYPDAATCFPGVDIAGGVCYFLWERDSSLNCNVRSMGSDGVKTSLVRPLLEEGCNTFIRFNEAIPILRKIRLKNEKSFSSLVSPQTPFGLVSSFADYSTKQIKGTIPLYSVNGRVFVKKTSIHKGVNLIDGYKVFIAKSYGERGPYPYYFLAKPFLGEKESCCTQTYLCVGTFKTERESKNVMSYIKTRFFRFCVMLKRNTQDAMRGVYEFVPIQDFSKPWTDAELYEKYELKSEEIAFIESMIRPME